MWIAIALALAIVYRRSQVFLLVAATSVVASLVNAVLKYAVGRQRPPSIVLDPEPLMEVPTTSSFPSGHAMSSFACAFVLARLAPRLAIPSFVLAALIAISRVYVGVHYPLDILVGAVLGVLLATALLKLLVVLRRSPRATRAG
ncbi:MAG TPA: phosphatase PAP2 family protein [Gaiellaceae bacterium]|nr:phosphatase PAP2 family protein [Gaiellaceae bacterium]